MINASIDIGSNSILLLIAKLNEGKIVEVLENESQVTGLGRNLDETGEFIPEAMKDSLNALADYANILKQYDVNNIVVTATEASRVAANASSFFKEVYEKTGLEIKIITGEAEAYYSTKGILLGSKLTDMVIMDIGGASTELIKLTNSNLDFSFSMPVGAVRLTNWFEKNLVNEKMHEAFNLFKDQLSNLKPTKQLYCVAGTMTSVANMDLENKEFIENQVHGHQINYSRICELSEKYDKYSPEQFLDEFPFLGKRSKTIRAGLYLAKSICEMLSVENLEVSTYGLRYGTLIEGEVKNEFIFK